MMSRNVGGVIVNHSFIERLVRCQELQQARACGGKWLLNSTYLILRLNCSIPVFAGAEAAPSAKC